MAERYAPYVHAGIVVVDDGKPYVHHAFAYVLANPGTGADNDDVRAYPAAKRSDSYLGAP